MTSWLDTGAIFSQCRQFRYTLWRKWSNCDMSRMVAFIGLNPSTADEMVNDPTVARCINFAKSWGYDGMYMLNIFAFRATDPKVMKAHNAPVGLENDSHLRLVVAGCDKTICAWGSHGDYLDRNKAVLSLLRDMPLHHLGLTKEGHPRHPLYLKANLKPVLMARR